MTTLPARSAGHEPLLDRISHAVLDPPRRSALRFPVAAATAAAAAAHIPVTAPHLHEAPYMGFLFILLIAALTVLTVLALLNDNTAVYAATVVTCGLAVLAYAATRVVAFPLLADDVGNWLEPLGVVSIGTEFLALTTALAALHWSATPPTSAPPSGAVSLPATA